MTEQKIVAVRDIIDAAPLSPRQILVFFMCFLAVAIDGFDTAVIGFVAPPIAHEWALDPENLAALFGAALLGSIVGSAILGPVADVIGRKTTLSAGTLMFGILTVVAAMGGNLESLTAFRFLAGIGLGGVLPCAIALTSEYAPGRKRSALVNAMFCGYTMGAAASGFIAAWIIPVHGWRMVFVAGGVIPILIAGLSLLLLPESLTFLASKGNRQDEIRRLIGHIAPSRVPHGWVPAAEPGPNHTPAKELFASRPVPGTVLLWTTAFAGLMSIYLLNSWLPLLLTKQGYSIREASLTGAMFQVGGTLGAICLGVVMDRTRPNRVIAAASLFAGVFLLCVGWASRDPVLLGAALFLVGVCIPGAQVGASAYAAAWYPTSVRATGISWMSGIGRIGSFIGSVGGGGLIGLGLGLGGLLGLLAIPMAVAAVSMAAHECIRVPDRL